MNRWDWLCRYNPRVTGWMGGGAVGGDAPAAADVVVENVLDEEAAVLRAAVGAESCLRRSDGRVLLRGDAAALRRKLGDCAGGAGRKVADCAIEALEAAQRRVCHLALPRGELLLGERTLVMGVVNVTPDSFSDGGRFLDAGRAVDHALRLVAEGADLLDIGGESTRPGAESVSPAEQIARALPVIEGVARRTRAPISVDTSSAEVARAALDAGAQVINDVTALRGDAELARVAAESGALVILMHMLGAPRTMQEAPAYAHLLADVCRFLRERIAAAVAAGIAEDRLLVDPGIGFGKTQEHNLELLRRLAELRSLGRPVVLGASRKSFIGRALGNRPPGERLFGTAATTALGAAAGAAIVRVHDVAAAVDVARVADAVCGGRREEWE